MINLSDAIEPIEKSISTHFSDSQKKGKKPIVLFLHTHPNYGQVHLYIRENKEIRDASDLIGTSIDGLIEIEGWEDASNEADAIFLKDGFEVKASDNGEFNSIIGEHAQLIALKLIEKEVEDHSHIRVIVMSESGEYYFDSHDKTQEITSR